MIEQATPTIALIGNPNTGKSTLFNALAGVRQRVGNYPGVTVEKKTGQVSIDGLRYTLVDLPGTYSLAPRSPDEMIAVDVLLGKLDDMPHVDVVLSIVDASNLERNLYVVSQVLELGLPTVIALNMIDVARQRGVSINADQLSRQLGVPVVPVQANRRIGVELLKAALHDAAGKPSRPTVSPFPEEFRSEVDRLCALFGDDATASATASRSGAANVVSGRSSQTVTAPGRRPAEPLPRFLVERLLLDPNGYLQDRLLSSGNGSRLNHLQAARDRLSASGHAVPGVEAVARYTWVARVLDGVIERPAQRVTTVADRVDRVLTHKLWGTLFFAAAMCIVFSSVFSGAQPLMASIDAGIGRIGDGVEMAMSAGPLRSLLVDGAIAGAGSVLVFLPQILILFLFLGVLEDCGYMARAAYLMDKLMVRVGLSGKSFIPLMSSFACAIPGVMATRVIENRRDRLTTILVAPLMSCSARLPVYMILIGAFIPRRALLGGLVPLQGLILLLMYLVGIVTAAAVALVLKKTLLRGPTPAFVLELPSYKWPSPRTVLIRMAERGWSFVRRAGTLILAVAICVWAASYFPHDTARVEGPYRPRLAEIETQLSSATSASQRRLLEEERATLQGTIAAAYQRQSWLGRAGHWIEPAVRPLGWDWRIGCAAIASFPAREVVIGALGVIYNLGAGIDAHAASDQSRLAARLRAATWEGTGEPVFNIPVALSIMVFFALCAQCASTLAVIKRETNSWGWPAFTFLYMTTLAYVAALLTYQVGMRIIGT